MQKIYVIRRISKVFLLATGFLFCCLSSFSQVGIGTTTPAPGSQLDVSSTTKGVLIPRMSAQQRADIGSPTEGLLVYQTDGEVGFWYYTSGAWVRLANANESSGALIPFASGEPISLTSSFGGIVTTVASLGFGNSAILPPEIGGVINTIVVNSNTAFVVPRNSVITAISGFFSTSMASNLPFESTVTCRLYIAPPGSNEFTRILASATNLSPTYSFFVPVGQTSFGATQDISVPVAAGSRLMMVFGVTSNIDAVITGFASGGITIK